MSSVRSREQVAAFERELQQEQVVPARPRKSGVAGNSPTASTREFTSAAEFQTAEPEVLPKLGPRAGGRTANQSVNGSVRSRLTAQRDAEQARRERPDRTAVAEYYLAEYDREQAEKMQREAREAREQQERQRKIKEQEQENLRNLNINLAFDSAPGGPATPEERRRVLAALKKFPDVSSERALSILLVLRGGI